MKCYCFQLTFLVDLWTTVWLIVRPSLNQTFVLINQDVCPCGRHYELMFGIIWNHMMLKTFLSVYNKPFLSQWAISHHQNFNSTGRPPGLRSWFFRGLSATHKPNTGASISTVYIAASHAILERRER